MVKAFYQNVHYEALRDRKVRRRPPGANIAFSGANPHIRDRVLDYFETTSVERVGILRGEYLLHPGGLLLADRKGLMTSACIALEDYSAAHALARQAAQPEMTTQFGALLEYWDRLPYADNLPVLCDPYSNNYFHFSLEMIPRLRHFADRGGATLLMTQDSLARPFQRDLLQHAAPSMKYVLMETGIRVRDPVLAHESMSEEGMLWLRQTSGISARPGKRRIYIRRAATGTRSAVGGGISESVGFTTLLRDFGFETVDFGNGEHGVAAQVAMLEGAGLILSAHGAALTNLAYLNPELTVIEVMGSRTPAAFFIHIAATLGFEYYGMFSSAYDDQLNIVVDLDELNGALCARV